MIACLLTLALLTPPPVATGRAYHYERPDAFTRVANVRHMPLLGAPVTAYVSVPDCGRVDTAAPWGVRFRLYDLKTQRWGPVELGQVVDCSAAKDVRAQTIKGIVPGGIETDAHTAQRYHFFWDGHKGAGKTSVQVLGYVRLRP